MTALAAARKTVLKYNVGDRYRDYVIAAGNTIYPGALVGLNAAGNAIAATATALWIAGIYTGDVHSGESQIALAGETIRVYEGEALLDIAAATLANIGDRVYCADDQTVTLTKSAAEPLVGAIVQYQTTTKVWVHIELPMNVLAEATLDLLGNVSQMQLVSGVTLNNGAISIVAGITVTAATRAFVVAEAVVTGSTNVGTFAHLVASNVVGGPGVGAVTLNLLGDDGAIDADADGTVAVLLIN